MCCGLNPRASRDARPAPRHAQPSQALGSSPAPHVRDWAAAGAWTRWLAAPAGLAWPDDSPSIPTRTPPAPYCIPAADTHGAAACPRAYDAQPADPVAPNFCLAELVIIK